MAVAALLASLVLHHYAPPPPKANLAPQPNFNQICAEVGVASPACQETTLEAIDAARRHEGLGSMALPRNWLSLTPAEQLFVITNLERVARREHPIPGLVAWLDGVAQAGALSRADPALPQPAAPYVSIWAETVSPLASDYGWMYADGYGGPIGTTNLDCRSAGAPGCWGHRNNILAEWSRTLLAHRTGTWYPVAGAAQIPIAPPPGTNAQPEVSDAMIVTAVPYPPEYVYTWAQAVAAGAGTAHGTQSIGNSLWTHPLLVASWAWVRAHAAAVLAVLAAMVLMIRARRGPARRLSKKKRTVKVHDISRYRR
ncbi:MAG: hypothetical protein M1272_01700 [Firmicutes bacterium]|nr:hypothetical protein [Bacillota bacterium]